MRDDSEGDPSREPWKAVSVEAGEGGWWGERTECQMPRPAPASTGVCRRITLQTKRR